MSLMLNVEIIPGTDIKDACNDAIMLAIKMNMMIGFDFNGIKTHVVPQDTVKTAVKMYDFFKKLKERSKE